MNVTGCVLWGSKILDTKLVNGKTNKDQSQYNFIDSNDCRVNGAWILWIPLHFLVLIILVVMATVLICRLRKRNRNEERESILNKSILKTQKTRYRGSIKGRIVYIEDDG